MYDPNRPVFQKVALDLLRRFPLQPYVPPPSPIITERPPDVFTPSNFDEFIGQEKPKDVCRIIVDSANIENRPIPNILIFGPYGLGKTTLARLIMERHNQPYRLIDGGSVSGMTVFKDYLIIDEIHNVVPDIADKLNTYMDNNLVHIIGCTTNPGMLPPAFRSRFRPINLDNYTVEDIEKIISNTLRRKKTRGSKIAIREIAQRSRYNPRNALQILSFTLELTTINQRGTLIKDTVKAALSKLDIDDKGLTAIDRKYLSILSSVKPTGLTQICAALGTDSETVEYEIEPFLISQGWIERTPRGRLRVEDISSDELLDMLKQSISIVQV